jgi:DNA-binding transcriptional LysR family regulator
VARQRAVRLLDLADDTWIRSTTRSSCSPFTERACRAAGFEPRVRFEFDDYTAMQNLVASGAGVAFAPDLGLSRLNPGVAVRPIAFGPKRRVHAAYRAGEREERGLPEMLAALGETILAREPLFPARAGAS